MSVVLPAMGTPLAISSRNMDSLPVRNIDLPLQIKASRDPAAVEAALSKLRASAALAESTGAGKHPMNLLRLSVEAARVRCTLGEISDALRGVWGEHKPMVRRSRRRRRIRVDT